MSRLWALSHAIVVKFLVLVINTTTLAQLKSNEHVNHNLINNKIDNIKKNNGVVHGSWSEGETVQETHRHTHSQPLKR